MTQTQRCRDCGDFYRRDDNELPIETDDGGVIDICHQCHTEFNRRSAAECDLARNFAEQERADAWQEYYQQLCQEER